MRMWRELEASKVFTKGLPPLLVLLLASIACEAQNVPLWKHVSDNAEVSVATSAAQYVIALMNIGIMFDPLTGNRIPFFNQFTQFERLMSASKHSPSVVYGIEPRFFLIVEVTQDSDPFPFLIETYQDSLGNWQVSKPDAVRPQAASYEVSIPITEMLWLSVKENEPAIVSARAAGEGFAKFLMENNYFPSVDPNTNMVEERLLLMKMRDVSPTSVAVAARNREVWDTEKLEKLDKEIDRLGSLLADRLQEKKQLLQSVQERILREGKDTRSGSYDSVESVEERLKRIELVVKDLETRLEAKEKDKGDLLKVIDENAKQTMRQRRQLFLYSDAWRTSDISSWNLQAHMPFSWDYQTLSDRLNLTSIPT
ncbi:hypothetical protein GUITHDRAFT_120084 [Guillardia theta CCMP2712]|uniref:Uncharacterized protein n=1 Tax=Guillardia theta (strain CCMP2712) TaxID=905079 RepID=L1ICP5_GUITC|nr:hypothetical protein GUITHDRAFT_120084 [Guillardia theta CCMP2712]EKX33694.1 hypothetical protein GUITHDRAFT_120084 [Guillardia theta CCMP2712]|eukprot:XP_005820674.1 hypothetical protein GUITHDRAFT_120084 [Guillardia theta CCMP2712]